MVSGIYFIIPTILVVFISFLIVRAAAIALMMTGLDEKRARFQARSAFTGTGFTTNEAELVVNHPKRRQIIGWLMILGNAGIVTVIVTATTSLVGSGAVELALDGLILLVGLFVIYKISTYTRFSRLWEGFIEKRLAGSELIEEGVTENLLHLLEGYGLVKVIVKEDSPLVDETLEEKRLPEKKLLVLGIERGKEWLPVPSSDEKIQKDDKIIVYGPLKILREEFRT